MQASQDMFYLNVSEFPSTQNSVCRNAEFFWGFCETVFCMAGETEGFFHESFWAKQNPKRPNFEGQTWGLKS